MRNKRLNPRLTFVPHRFGVDYFFPAFIFAHRARCAALILAKPAAEICRLGLVARALLFEPLRSVAHLARCAAPIRANPAAEMWRFGLAAQVLLLEPPRSLAHR